MVPNGGVEYWEVLTRILRWGSGRVSVKKIIRSRGKTIRGP